MTTKRLYYILSVALFSFTLSTIAQETVEERYVPEPKYGFRLGANYSTINSDNISEDIDDRFGFIAGFLAEYPLSTKVSIQPEIQYSSQGMQIKELRSAFIQLPVFLKYNVSSQFNLHLGPQLGIKVWQWEDRNKQADFTNFSDLDVSAVAGIGFSLSESIFMDLRYAYGFLDAFEDVRLGVVEGGNIEGNNSYFQLTIGYKL